MEGCDCVWSVVDCSPIPDEDSSAKMGFCARPTFFFPRRKFSLQCHVFLLTCPYPSSQSEYDIAVIETQARRPVSVKVKQFSLQGARIHNDWQGPQMVKYKNKLHPWKYIVVLPVSRSPIKIASPNLSQLKPVHEGIRRVLQAQQQQRERGGHGPTSGPADPYRGPVGGGGGGGGGMAVANTRPVMPTPLPPITEEGRAADIDVVNVGAYGAM